MHTGSSNSRPTVAHALELALRKSEPVRRPHAVAVGTTTTGESASVPASYFAPGDFVGEQDWWAKQLARR